MYKGLEPLILCAATSRFYSVYVTVLLGILCHFKDVQQLVFRNTVLDIPTTENKPVVIVYM